MPYVTFLLALLLAVSATQPIYAGLLDFSKKKETTIIKPGAKKFKTIEKKKFATKKKASKKYKTPAAQQPNIRQPGNETLDTKKGLINTDEPIQHGTITGETKQSTLIDDALVDQVVDQKAVSVKKEKKPKKKKKATQSDINKYSKVKKDGSEETTIQKAGGE